MGAYEHASLSELIRTDHKILNKVITVFAALCSEISEHKQKVIYPLTILCVFSLSLSLQVASKYYLPLLMYGGGKHTHTHSDH